MCLAVKAAKTNSVGTITPYNAQARLLNAMSRDLENTAPELKKITCATVHQFQGAERDVIIFDAVDCYHAKIAGKMLTETTNNYANRLFNVALTRAKGKIISVMNVDYIRKRVNNSRLIFRRMINILFAKKKIYGGKPLLDEINNTIVPLFDIENAEKAFLNDIANTRHEISIDIPGGSTGTAQWLQTLYNLLDNAEKRGVKITVRTDNIEGVPEILRSFCYSCYYLTDPIAIFDHSIVWYGMPLSTNDFRPEKQVLKTKFRPIFRYKGAFFAQSLSGFLDINRNMKSIPDEF